MPLAPLHLHRHRLPRGPVLAEMTGCEGEMGVLVDQDRDPSALVLEGEPFDPIQTGGLDVYDYPS
jgi:hypothetical protein